MEKIVLSSKYGQFGSNEDKIRQFEPDSYQCNIMQIRDICDELNNTTKELNKIVEHNNERRLIKDIKNTVRTLESIVDIIEGTTMNNNSNIKSEIASTTEEILYAQLCRLHLNDMTLDHLRIVAKRFKINGYETMNARQLRRRIPRAKYKPLRLNDVEAEIFIREYPDLDVSRATLRYFNDGTPFVFAGTFNNYNFHQWGLNKLL
jgi:hypothetical protein